MIFTGLKNIHKLTSVGSVDLRIEMSSFDGRNKYAEYKLVSKKKDNYFYMLYESWSIIFTYKKLVCFKISTWLIKQ